MDSSSLTSLINTNAISSTSLKYAALATGSIFSLLLATKYLAHTLRTRKHKKQNNNKRRSQMSAETKQDDTSNAAAAASSSPDTPSTDASTAETVHVLKANKSTGIKSSYYHFSSTPAHEAERYKPQLITDPNAIPAVSPPPQIISTSVSANLTAPPSASTVAMAAPTAIGGSRWNAAGTWEEVDISSWAHPRFKELIATVDVPSVSGRFTSWEKLSGDCNIIFSRGKKKHGYDIAGIVNFTAKIGSEGKDIKGQIEFPEIADSVSDEPWQVLISIKDPTSETKAQGELIYDAFKAAVPQIRKKIDQWVEELKAQQ